MSGDGDFVALKTARDLHQCGTIACENEMVRASCELPGPGRTLQGGDDMAKRTTLQRFLAKLGEPDPVSGCVVFLPAVKSGKHGIFYGPEKRLVYAHRYAYETFVGPIPEGLVLDHLCRNPPCCNVEHLEPVTQGENVRRGNGPAGLARHIATEASKTHCKNGHEYTPENTYRWAGMPHRRQCKACLRENERRRRARLRGQA